MPHDFMVEGKPNRKNHFTTVIAVVLHDCCTVWLLLCIQKISPQYHAISLLSTGQERLAAAVRIH